MRSLAGLTSLDLHCSRVTHAGLEALRRETASSNLHIIQQYKTSRPSSAVGNVTGAATTERPSTRTSGRRRSPRSSRAPAMPAPVASLVCM
jgi:hypothetical protein